MRSLKDNGEEYQVAYDELGSLRAVSRKFKCSPNTVRLYLRADQKIKTQQIVKAMISRDKFLIGLYIGLWMGDGTQYREKSSGRYTIKICTNRDDMALNDLIQKLLLQLFGKTSVVYFDLTRSNAKGAVIKFHSKFIYDFVYSYVRDDTAAGMRKAHTVRLRHDHSFYSQNFLEGCLLGLILSDGCIREQLHFHVTSPFLVGDAFAILARLGFHPSIYIRKPATARDRALHMLWLGRPESRKLELFFDGLLQGIDINLSYRKMKMSPP